MKKVIKLIILIILSCSVYFIYQQTKNSTISVTSIGDNYSLGINSYGIKEYSYTDYYVSYLKKEKVQVSYNQDYQARDLTIKTLIEKVTNDPHFKNILSESNIIILTIGYNDLLYNLSITEKLNNNTFKQIMNTLNKNYNDLIEEIRKYFKDKVYNTIIPRLVRLVEAPSHGKPINEYDPKSKATEAYANLAKEVIARDGN